jgi:hypothetical protein
MITVEGSLMLSTRVAIAAVVLMGSAGLAQGQKPNFSGTWLMVAPAEAAVQPPGQEETIAQTDKTITFGHPSEGGGHNLTYRLDGQWMENVIAGMRFETRATWEGRTLVLVDRGPGGSELRPGVRESTKRLHIDENGSLIMEMNPPIPDLPGGPAKLVWRKR